jgi:hypothetical protein
MAHSVHKVVLWHMEVIQMKPVEGRLWGRGSVAVKTVSMGDDVGRLNRVEFQCVALTTPTGTALFSSFLSS